MIIGEWTKPSVPPVTPGVYTAVCVQSINEGTQMAKKRTGEEYECVKVCLVFELIGETVEIDGETKPRLLNRTFNVGKGPNGALRKFVESMRGQIFSNDAYRQFDTASLLGQGCQLSVVLSDNGEYANVDTAIPMPKGSAIPVATTPLIKFDLRPWDDAAFKALPTWAQEAIQKSAEYKKDHLPTDKVDFPLDKQGEKVDNGGVPF